MADNNTIRVWDLAVRVFHWSLVILFFVAYFTGDETEQLHVYAGYGVLALVAFRVVWGFVGTKYARFSDFLYGPTAIVAYIKSVRARVPLHYVGHNPLGGLMVVALLLSLGGTCWSGLVVYGKHGHGPLARADIELVAPAYAHEEEDEGRDRHEAGGGEEGDHEVWDEIHETFANFTLFLVFLHVAGVFVAGVTHKENLVKAMLTGYKQR